MDAKAKLRELAGEFNLEINKVFATEAERLKTSGQDFLSSLVSNSKHIANGGKRLRGAFTCYGYLLHGGSDRAEIIKAAVAVEIIHAYLLIHDDVMDQDAMRRGAKTLHQIYSENFEILSAGNNKKSLQGDRTAKAMHFGESVAVCVGDVYSSIANDILLKSNFPAEKLLKAMQKLHEKLIDVGYGQTLDILQEIKANSTEAEILHILLLKTGEYTYEMPLQIGALLAGANQADLDQLTKYAHPAGIAFQIQDDILGIYGDPETTGKSASSDLKQGKQSLPIFKAFELASASDREFLLSIVGNHAASEADFARAREIIANCGALDYCKQKALDLVNVAKEALNYPGWSGEGKDFMAGVADYMINREL